MKPMTRFSCIVGGGCLTLLAGGSQLEGRRAAQSLPAAGTESRAPFTLSGLPVDLIENHGQWDTSARFVATRGAAWTALEPDGRVNPRGSRERAFALGLAQAGRRRAQ